MRRGSHRSDDLVVVVLDVDVLVVDLVDLRPGVVYRREVGLGEVTILSCQIPRAEDASGHVLQEQTSAHKPA